MAPFLSEVFHFHQPGQLRSPGRSLQNAAALGSPIRRPHFAVYGDYSRAPSADRLAPAHLGVVPHPDHAGILRRGVARLSSHMDINCGCFPTPEPIGPKKILENPAPLIFAPATTLFAFLQ